MSILPYLVSSYYIRLSISHAGVCLNIDKIINHITIYIFRSLNVGHVYMKFLSYPHVVCKKKSMIFTFSKKKVC